MSEQVDEKASNQRHASRWAGLAALRFFLAVCVVFGHISLFIRRDPAGVFGFGVLNPGSAVYGFFILSGYSIAASVARETTGFYQRRVIRIWPLYLATIAAGLLIEHFIPAGFAFPSGNQVPLASGLSIAASVLMLQTVIAVPMPSVGPIWSLCPEWWHYMFAPLFKRAPVLILLGLIELSWMAFMLIGTPAGGGIDQLAYGLTVLVSSWLWISGFVYFRLRTSRFSFLILLLPSVVAAGTHHFIGWPLFITVLVLVLSSRFTLSRPVIAVFNFLGDWSFPLYLFHLPTLIGALLLFGPDHLAVIVCASFVTSLAALFLIDYPTRRIFARFSRGRPSFAPVAEQDRASAAQPAP